MLSAIGSGHWVSRAGQFRPVCPAAPVPGNAPQGFRGLEAGNGKMREGLSASAKKKLGKDHLKLWRKERGTIAH